MANETYEANLLRVVIGFLHVSLCEQFSLTRHGKPFHTRTDDEKAKLQDKMLTNVMTLARQVDEETLKKFLAAPPPAPLTIH